MKGQEFGRARLVALLVVVFGSSLLVLAGCAGELARLPQQDLYQEFQTEKRVHQEEYSESRIQPLWKWSPYAEVYVYFHEWLPVLNLSYWLEGEIYQIIVRETKQQDGRILLNWKGKLDTKPWWGGYIHLYVGNKVNVDKGFYITVITPKGTIFCSFSGRRPWRNIRVLRITRYFGGATSCKG